MLGLFEHSKVLELESSLAPASEMHELQNEQRKLQFTIRLLGKICTN